MSTKSKELVLDTFKNIPHKEIPVWFMRQAGRYLPEYLEIRDKYSFEERVQSPEIASEITLQPINRFDLDAAIIFSDILIPIYYMNRGLKIVENKGPIIENPIKCSDDVYKLSKPNAKENYPYLAESIQKVKKNLSNKALFGFSGAPFTLASYLIEGQTTRDCLKTKSFAFNYPTEFHYLLELLADIIIEQLKSEINAGCDLYQIFDSWAIYLSKTQFDTWSLPYLKRIIKELGEIPGILYARGSSHLFESMIKTGISGISIDGSMRISKAHQLNSEIVLQGNLDPAVLLANPKVVDVEVKKLLEEVNNNNIFKYIFNLATGINKDSNISNVTQMVYTIKNYRRNLK